MSTDTAVTTDSTRNVSEARLRANRLNALKSTGPRTPLGKGRSRRNGLKHGLSGAGVVLPDDMRAEVDRLIAAYTREFRPANESERQLVEDRALGRVRSKHAWSAETIYLAQESERAASDALWRSDRQADAAELGARLGRRPGVVVARLEGTLDGVRWLRERWLHLDVALANAGCLDEDQVRLALQLLGTPEEFVEKDPAGLGRWALEDLKELTRRQIESLDELEADCDLQEADEADRQRALGASAGSARQATTASGGTRRRPAGWSAGRPRRWRGSSSCGLGRPRRRTTMTMTSWRRTSRATRTGRSSSGR
jgi:hypothetical protein